MCFFWMLKEGSWGALINLAGCYLCRWEATSPPFPPETLLWGITEKYNKVLCSCPILDHVVVKQWNNEKSQPGNVSNHTGGKLITSWFLNTNPITKEETWRRGCSLCWKTTAPWRIWPLDKLSRGKACEDNQIIKLLAPILDYFVSLGEIWWHCEIVTCVPLIPLEGTAPKTFHKGENLTKDFKMETFWKAAATSFPQQRCWNLNFQ